MSATVTLDITGRYEVKTPSGRAITFNSILQVYDFCRNERLKPVFVVS